MTGNGGKAGTGEKAARFTGRVRALVIIIGAVVVVVIVIVVVVISSNGDQPATTTAAAQPTTTQPTETTTPPTTTVAFRTPTEADIRGASLLFIWPVDATKTETLIPPPDPFEVGYIYMFDLEVEGITDDAGNYAQVSRPHFPIFGFTVVGELEAWPWEPRGDRWVATPSGYYVSADYGDENICIYEWIEDWDIQLTDAVQNGNTWLATAFEGTMVRTEQLDADQSAVGIANGYCPSYEASDRWSVTSTRDMAPIP